MTRQLINMFSEVFLQCFQYNHRGTKQHTIRYITVYSFLQLCDYTSNLKIFFKALSLDMLALVS